MTAGDGGATEGPVTERLCGVTCVVRDAGNGARTNSVNNYRKFGVVDSLWLRLAGELVEVGIANIC